MLSKKKKIFIMVAMFGLLVVTGYLNIALNNRVIDVGGKEIITANFYVTYRQDRQVSRETAILYYDSIIANETSSQEAKTIAETSRQALIKTMETELAVEGLIKAQGFEDVVLVTTTENVNIIIKANDFTRSELATIKKIVQEQTGKSSDNIKIIPSK